MEVPKEPKVYTSVYDNFKGVDFTNDPSNVFRRRSPSGKNMLPDLDGRPYKRKGWEVAISAEEFKEAAEASASVVVVPDKMYGFEIGGEEQVMIFNNLGVFAYKITASGPQLLYLSEYTDLSGNTQTFPPLINGQEIPVDSRRAFFFEGRGTAGFYMFVGLKLFRYDGTSLHEEEPKIPKVLIGCIPDGTGEMYESVNLLTRKRKVGYTCDGNATSFTLPGGVKTGTSIVCEHLENDGEYHQISYHDLSVDGVVTFQTAPAATVRGEDNLVITYETPGADITVDTESVDLSEKTIRTTIIETQRRLKVGEDGEPKEWEVVGTTVEYDPALFETPNIVLGTNRVKDITFSVLNEDQWVSVLAGDLICEWCAYIDAASVRANASPDELEPTSTRVDADEPSKWTVFEKGEVKIYAQTRRVKTIRTYRVKATYGKYSYIDSDLSPVRTAFTQCSKVMIFGNGIINQVFMTASPHPDYTTRLWYSAATDPTYFPDLNYVEVGATDKPIMGMLKVGQYLGIVKRSESIETSIYLAYPTSFADMTTYAVKQNIPGIGAVSKSAFNTLNDEPLFLSRSGVMGIDMADEESHVKRRSYYIDKRLTEEPNLEKAVSFVYDGLYYLAINNRCYVLDGSQKNSWANTKTNLQYECYYLENIPAQCFAQINDELWFSDFLGNVCRFKTDNDEYPYRDDYYTGDPTWTTVNPPEDGMYDVTSLDGFGHNQALMADSLLDLLADEEENVLVLTIGVAKVGDNILYTGGDKPVWYTVMEVEGQNGRVEEGIPIIAEWSTIADDDGMVHFFKNLRKKGCVISLLPASDSGVEVYIKADNKDPVFVGETDAKDYYLPYEVYSKKKIKKYKRLQFICRNSALNDSFGIDQIIKSYTVGNYSKNRK